jgi:DNA-binding GntR family transcriptional regulator
MTAKDVWEAYTLKATLYEMAMELAMENMTVRQVAELESIVKKMEECANAETVDLLGYQKYHQEFHDKIMLISGNERLKKISASIHLQVCRFSYKSLQNNAHLNSSLRYHRRIITALKKKNRPLACKLMKNHVLEALDVLLDIFDLNEETTEEYAIKAVASD